MSLTLLVGGGGSHLVSLRALAAQWGGGGEMWSRLLGGSSGAGLGLGCGRAWRRLAGSSHLHLPPTAPCSCPPPSTLRLAWSVQYGLPWPWVLLASCPVFWGMSPLVIKATRGVMTCLGLISPGILPVPFLSALQALQRSPWTECMRSSVGDPGPP